MKESDFLECVEKLGLCENVGKVSFSKYNSWLELWKTRGRRFSRPAPYMAFIILETAREMGLCLTLKEVSHACCTEQIKVWNIVKKRSCLLSENPVSAESLFYKHEIFFCLTCAQRKGALQTIRAHSQRFPSFSPRTVTAFAVLNALKEEKGEKGACNVPAPAHKLRCARRGEKKPLSARKVCALLDISTTSLYRYSSRIRSQSALSS